MNSPQLRHPLIGFPVRVYVPLCRNTHRGKYEPPSGREVQVAGVQRCAVPVFRLGDREPPQIALGIADRHRLPVGHPSPSSISVRIAFRRASSRGIGHASSQAVTGSFSGVSMHGVATILPHFSEKSRFSRVSAGGSSPITPTSINLGKRCVSRGLRRSWCRPASRPN